MAFRYVTFVGNDQQFVPVGGQGRVVVEDHGQDLAFVDLGVGEGPGDREPELDPAVRTPAVWGQRSWRGGL